MVCVMVNIYTRRLYIYTWVLKHQQNIHNKVNFFNRLKKSTFLLNHTLFKKDYLILVGLGLGMEDIKCKRKQEMIDKICTSGMQNDLNILAP